MAYLVSDINNGKLNYVSYYDFRDGAANKPIKITFRDYYVDHYGYDIYSGYYHDKSFESTELPEYVADTANESGAVGVTVVNVSLDPYGDWVKTFEDGMVSGYRCFNKQLSQSFSNFKINLVYYGINTTGLYNLYQHCVNTYGLAENSLVNDESLWQEYLKAMSDVKALCDGKLTNTEPLPVFLQIVRENTSSAALLLQALCRLYQKHHIRRSYIFPFSPARVF